MYALGLSIWAKEAYNTRNSKKNYDLWMCFVKYVECIHVKLYSKTFSFSPNDKECRVSEKHPLHIRYKVSVEKQRIKNVSRVPLVELFAGEKKMCL